MTISFPKGGAPAVPVEAVSAIAVIDDASSIRNSLADLLESMGFDVTTFASASEFLDAGVGEDFVCILLDVRLQGMSGLELQDRLNVLGSTTAIVFITGYADVNICVRAMRGGAIDFLQKPFREQDLLDAVVRAEGESRHRREIAQVSEGIRNKMSSLTTREREVLDGICKGLLNKQIAAELGISEITVKVHRGHVMRKMKVRTAAELVKHASLHSFIDTHIAKATSHQRTSLARGAASFSELRRIVFDLAM
ncbi:response regulator transcription factor [Rhizobium sp. AG207R]|uniref:response regulator transcription factor n=1 Tax=Rhizobium sp. AG207R TaxID=2802287 RepID=UPI0022AC3290|nr:response regulator [Rhizobium sp. AG207R]MCZ3380550.1 response regulator transcription factor [Rhizobium sp. AG207R]